MSDWLLQILGENWLRFTNNDRSVTKSGIWEDEMYANFDFISIKTQYKKNIMKKYIIHAFHKQHRNKREKRREWINRKKKYVLSS